MVLEEPMGELMGLESQLRDQIVPSGAGRVRRGRRRGIGRLVAYTTDKSSEDETPVAPHCTVSHCRRELKAEAAVFIEPAGFEQQLIPDKFGCADPMACRNNAQNPIFRHLLP
jgi:hypothetical protein